MLKPDFLDLDKDGNTKEPMKEAAKDREPMYGGGILSDDMDMYQREQFKVGNLVSFMRKMQKGKKGAEDLSDDIMERGVTSPQDALKMLEDKEIRMDELKDLLIASGYSKADVDTFVQKYMEDSVMADMTKEEKALFRKKDFAGLEKLSKREKEIFNEPMTDAEIDEALDNLRDEFALGGAIAKGVSKVAQKSRYNKLKNQYEEQKDAIADEEWGFDKVFGTALEPTREVTPQEAKKLYSYFMEEDLRIPNKIRLGGTEGAIDRVWLYELQMVAAGKKPQKLNSFWIGKSDSEFDKKNVNDVLDMALKDIEEQEIKRKKKADGGSVDEEREQYNIGKLVRKALQKKGVQEKIPGADALYDNLPPSFRERVTFAEDSLEKLNKEKLELHEQLMKLKGDKGFSEAMEDAEFRALSRKYDENYNQINKVTRQLKKLGINPRDIIPPRKSKNDGGMLPDEQMEDNYIDFILDEALTEKEEDMLMSKLEQDEDLSMLFDKVIEVASEFAGSGPVEGPGTGVSDSIPARLSDGEFVFTAKAVEEIGADELMRMMKDAEMKADKRQKKQAGGIMEEETVKVEATEPTVPTQVINVKKETLGPQASVQEEEDLVKQNITTRSMLGRSSPVS